MIKLVVTDLDGTLLTSQNEVDNKILKIAVYNKKGIEKTVYDKIKIFKNKFDITITGENWLDIMRINSNKGVVIDIIKIFLNLTSDEIIAFGDYLNDYEMIKNVKYGVVMGNSHLELKKITKIVTKSNDDNEIAEVLEKFI